jgi:hypothetical protein
MRTSFSRYSLLLLLGFIASVLSSCAGLAAAADPPPQVTPDTTDPSTLVVMMTIYDDENATDGKVGISLQFATNEIKDPNYIAFTKGEEVFCNGVRLTLNAPAYTARVSAENGKFTCDYIRQGRAYSISERARPSLEPALSHDNKFVLSYTHESRGLSYCPMQVDTSDANSANPHDKFTEGPSGSHQVNHGSLSGVGSLILTRTCPSELKGHEVSPDRGASPAATPFGDVKITYTSVWRLYVTWI